MGTLIEEAQRGNLEGVRQALANGANINQRDAGQDTALTWASYKGHAEVVRILLENGADPNIPNQGGATPLQLALSYGGAETANVIKEHLERPKSPWIRLDADVLSHVATYPAIRQSLTTLFNFKSRERLIIACHTGNNTQSMTPPLSFDSLSPAILEEALDQFTRLGGSADRDYVLSGARPLDKLKIRLSGPSS